MSIDLNALLYDVRRQVAAEHSLNTPIRAQRARSAQRRSLEQRADEHANRLELRARLARALERPEMDAGRFKWLCDHLDFAKELTGLPLDDIRREIDSEIKHEACARLAAMRRRDAELRGQPLPHDEICTAVSAGGRS